MMKDNPSPVPPSSQTETDTHLYKEWDQANFRAVNKFYRSQKHKGSASADERVFVVQDDEDNILAAVRLVPHDEYYWLRSLYVDASLRGNGMGTRLLHYVHQHTNQTIHCFPYTHLEGFYQACNYVLSDHDTIPQALMQLYQRYNRKGEGIIIMSHTPLIEPNK